MVLSPERPRALLGSPRVLFVSHEATRTGAPMMLLHFLRWLRANTDLAFEVLLLAGGPLVPEFRALAPTRLVEALGTGRASYFEAGVTRAGFPRLANRIKLARTERLLRDLRSFDVLYLNSATSALALRLLPDVPPLVVSHVHELRSAFRYWFPEADRDLLLESTDWFVACSDGVGLNLIESYGIPRERVSRHYEFIEAPVADPDRGHRQRADLGIPAGARLIGGSGVVNWRKGPDLFVQVAAALTRVAPHLDVHFLWIGGSGDEHLPVVADAARLGVGGRVHFVGEVDDPADLFSILDVFCLTSREDPYPLVMLEAAALGVPVVSFANGGAAEFARDPEGSDELPARIVPYLDVEAMASTVAELLDDEEARLAVARRGQERVLREHSIDVGSAALYKELLRRFRAHGTGGQR